MSSISGAEVKYYEWDHAPFPPYTFMVCTKTALTSYIAFDFHETWYGNYAVEGHYKLVCSLCC